MKLSDLLLVIVSGAGLLHGITVAFYLLLFKKKRTLPNILLALALILMAFRIGKSLMLNFAKDLEPQLIFLGLTFLLVMGPLLRWYVMGMTKINFKLPPYALVELIPFFMVFTASLFVTKNWFHSNSKEVILVFGSVLLVCYFHLLAYIFLAYGALRKAAIKWPKHMRTKSQNHIFHWLYLLIIGFVVIWVSYFLNIIENTVPYITGPVLYSLGVYFLSIKAFQLRITDVDGQVFRDDDRQLFDQLSKLIADDKLYLDPGISLNSLSKTVAWTTQKTSQVINQYARQSFNDYINTYRIQEAKKKLLEQKMANLTIASIAFDVGFSSLSSFNAAFKKFVGTTPSVYRKQGSFS